MKGEREREPSNDRMVMGDCSTNSDQVLFPLLYKERKEERKKERKRRKEKGGLFLCKCSILWIHLTLTWLKEAAFEVLYSFPIFNYLKIIYLSFLFLVNFRAFVNLFKMVSTIPEQEESRLIVEVVVVVVVVYSNNYLKHNCSSCHKKEHS